MMIWLFYAAIFYLSKEGGHDLLFMQFFLKKSLFFSLTLLWFTKNAPLYSRSKWEQIAKTMVR
jgi:hypothetical protein